MAFVLLCKCGVDNELRISNLWIGRYLKYQETKLLDFLSLIITAYEQKDPVAGNLTVEFSLQNALQVSLSAENVTLEEVMKYGHEIGFLKQRWDTLMGIENEKWQDGPSPIEPPPKPSTPIEELIVFMGAWIKPSRDGQYKKGRWEDQLGWAYEFLSSGEITKLEDRLRNAEYCGVDDWGRIKTRKRAAESSKIEIRIEDSPTDPWCGLTYLTSGS